MKRFFLFVLVMMAVNTAFSQAPEQFKYQALLRDGSGNIKANANTTIAVSILRGSPTGTAIFEENHTATTNAQGIVNLNIGSQIPGLGNIDWAANSYYIRITVDGTEMGTSQLLSVPYALYAGKAGNGLNITGNPQLGDILFNNGSGWSLLSKGSDGEVLKMVDGQPRWKVISVSGSAVPAAIFTVSQLLGNTTQTITVDASGVADDIDPASQLQVRWRWDDNGTFTSWTTTKTASNVYVTEGSKSITLEVKDSNSNVGTSSKTIVISNLMFIPLVTTNMASNITTGGATAGGIVISNGGADVTARGVCWSLNQNPTIVDSKTADGSGLGEFDSKITELVPGKTYFIRAYATNSSTTGYGNQVTIHTVPSVVFPTVTTLAATNLTATAANSGGNVISTGGAEVTERGVCWSTNQNPSITDNKVTSGTGVGSYAAGITNLSPGVTYYARAYAINSSGAGYGAQISFITVKTLPIITTKNITEISAMGGACGGNIISAGGGTISEKGLVWGENENPVLIDKKISSGSGLGSYTSSITTAIPATTYYARAFATNEFGTVYGEQKTFTTSDAYYYGFESGLKPAGWAGTWSVVNSGFNSDYCLRSPYGTTSDIGITLTLDKPGQIRFFYRFSDWVGETNRIESTRLCFYLDDVLYAYYGSDRTPNWQEGSIDFSAGTHNFRWRFFPDVYSSRGYAYGYLDYVIITK